MDFTGMKLNLDPAWYVDPGHFREERDSVFSRSWQLLGPVSRVREAGQYVSEDIAGMKVLVIRGQDGELRGFRNVCRHRGAQLLARGTGLCRTIRCPYHNWSYHDDGRLRHAPWFGEDRDFDPAEWPLEPIQVDCWRGLLFVSVDPQQSLPQQLGDTIPELDDVAMEALTCTDSETLSFGANWKIYTDNFVEGYHIPGIHPAFHAAIDFERFETTAWDGLVKMTAPAKQDLFYRGRWYWMWPNWTLSLFQGGINTSRINPLDESRTELIYHFYFEDDALEAADARRQTIERNLAVIKEDFGICLETHRNYASGGYRSGPLSPRHEQGVAYFQDRYLADMTA